MTSEFDYDEFTTRNIGFISNAEQERLRRSHVFVAGVGGMGGAVTACLARIGVGALTLADIDVFEVSNLNRQLFATFDVIGESKVETTRKTVERINPDCQIRTLGKEWTDEIDDILDRVDIAVNGCDDVRATLRLMRAAQGRVTVVDAFASTLPNVYVVGPEDVRPEELFGYPSVGLSLEQLDDQALRVCAEREIEYVLTHSSTADHVELEIAGEMISGKRSRISFAPMVIGTGCLMAYEVARTVLGKPGGPGPRGIFWNPWTGQSERPRTLPVAAVRRAFVRSFVRNLSGDGSGRLAVSPSDALGAARTELRATWGRAKARMRRFS